MTKQPHHRWQLDLGARMLDSEQVHFRVWAPRASHVAVRVNGQARAPISMEPGDLGYYETTIRGLMPGARYTYILNAEKERPDPASRFQPDGVHKPSAVVDPAGFAWTDQAWRGHPQEELIIYELHAGTFSAAGTFEGIIPSLDYLRDDVGVTAVELMPVAQFPGTRNWGYDGAYLYAPQASYGGPDGLKALVNACHAKGLAVVLDVVYNHLGPEGNYLGDFGPYFTDRHRTPWGSAINYDGPDSDEVRHFIISNALYWIVEYHIDALRLDAIHGIFDFSAYHILQELNDRVHAQADRIGRSVSIIAESDLNDVRVIAPVGQGGFGLDGQWNDDFHHALHAVVTGERTGYYADFGRVEHLATAIRDGYVLAGTRSVYRRRRHGNSSRGRPPSQFVVFAQNHDQIGNRAIGDRLSTVVPDALNAIAATVLLVPYIPLLFMGEEYGETAPFQYFTSHGDADLAEAVRQGRRREFAHFGWKKDIIPDPQDPSTFERSRVHPGSQVDPERRAILHWTKSLLALRKAVPALGPGDTDARGCSAWAYEDERVLVMHRWATTGPAALIVLSFNAQPTTITLREPVGSWDLRLAATAREFAGGPTQTPPQRLRVSLEGTAVELAAYAALVYLTPAPT